MKDLLGARVPPGLAFKILAGLVAIVAIYVSYEIGKINGRHDGEEASAGTAEDDVAVAATPKQPMRVPLFVDPEQVRYVTRFNFTYDPVDALADYRRREELDQIANADDDDFSRAVALMRWTSRQWEPGRPDPYPPIDAKRILDEIRAGRTGGFCAQYNFVFVQAVQSFGMRARYVSIANHEVTEVWIPELDRWVCFDPQHDAYFTDAEGRPLSVHEIWQSVHSAQPVSAVGNPRFESLDVHLRKFRRFAVWLKNDHVSVPMNFADIRRHKVHFLTPGADPTEIPPSGLQTTNVIDLYFDPFTGNPPQQTARLANHLPAPDR